MNRHTTEQINQLLAQLRKNLADVLPTNQMFDNFFYLYRWLIHNQMNVDRAEGRIRKSIEWRKEVDLEELVERDWAYFAPGLEKEIIVTIDGLTKRGQPVTIVNGSGINLSTVLETYGKDNVLRYYFQLFGKIERRTLDDYKMRVYSAKIDKTPKYGGIASNVSKPDYDSSWDSCAPINISNYKDSTFFSATSVDGIQFLVELAKTSMAVFPALVSTFYIINLNSFTNLALKVLKPIISSDGVNLEFHDTNKSKWSKVLLEHVDADQLPVYFGGKKIVEGNK